MRTHRSRRTSFFLAALAVPLLVLGTLGCSATAAPAPTYADDAVVQYRVAPTGGPLDALAQRLIAAGYDVSGGGSGVLFVHAPASARGELAGRGDLAVVGEQVVPASQDDVLPRRLHGSVYETSTADTARPTPTRGSSTIYRRRTRSWCGWSTTGPATPARTRCRWPA